MNQFQIRVAMAIYEVIRDSEIEDIVSNLRVVFGILSKIEKHGIGYQRG